MIAGVDYSNAKSMQLACAHKLRALEAELKDGEKRLRDYAPSLKEMHKERTEIVDVVREWTREVQKLVSGGSKEVGKGGGDGKKGFEIGRDALVGKVNEEFAGGIFGWFARKYGSAWGKDGLAIEPVSVVGLE